MLWRYRTGSASLKKYAAPICPCSNDESPNPPSPSLLFFGPEKSVVDVLRVTEDDDVDTDEESVSGVLCCVFGGGKFGVATSVAAAVLDDKDKDDDDKGCGDGGF